MNMLGNDREVRYVRIKVKHALSRSGLPDIDYALNPYAGCYHSCIYCYARAYTRYEDASRKWGSVVYIKENIIDVLRREVRRVKKGVVGLATITDPYQPVEANERITRGSLAVLLRNGFKVDIQTKSPLVVRDLDLLTQYADRVEVGFTITTLRNNVAAVIEPRAPLPRYRVEALEKVSSEGISTWVFLGPVIPGVNDGKEMIKEVVEIASSTGSALYYDWLRLRPEIINSLTEGLKEWGLSVDSFNFRASWRKKLENEITAICTSLGVKCYPAFP